MKWNPQPSMIASSPTPSRVAFLADLFKFENINLKIIFYVLFWTQKFIYIT
jgi:hypothetical protein